jgi:PKD repeat protein
VPVTDFEPTPDKGCKPLTVSFNAKGDTAWYYSWDFGDGNTDAGMNVKHTYTDTGNITIRLSARDKQGCLGFATKSVHVFGLPESRFDLSPQTSCFPGTTVQFTNLSKNAIAYRWDFGNGKTSAINNPAMKYDSVGTYTITLISRNYYGCSDTFVQHFEIYDRPAAAFIVQPFACEEDFVQFQNTSSKATRFLWDFGDGHKDTTFSPMHIYSKEGKYTVTLHVWGAGECADSTSQAQGITVLKKPLADFNYTIQVQNDTITGWVDFEGKDPSYMIHLWDFGDMRTDTTSGYKLRHRYDLPGAYEVKYIVGNILGCYDTISKPLLLDYFDGLYVPNALNPSRKVHEEDIFLPKGANLATYQLQIFNAWGELVWETTDIQNGHPKTGWDGRNLSGKDMPQGVYVWRITATFRNGKTWEGKKYDNGTRKTFGTVTLIR